MHGPSAPVFLKWAKTCGLERNTTVTDEELDAKIADWGKSIRVMQKQLEQRGVHHNRSRKTDQKFGPPPVTTLSAPTTIEGYMKMIEECLEHVAANLQRGVNLEDKAKAIMLGTLFMQLKMNLTNPLNMITVADQERVFNQVQKLLGMNDEKKSSRRIDINILNARVEQPKDTKKKARVFEAEIIKTEPVAARLPGPSVLDDFEV